MLEASSFGGRSEERFSRQGWNFKWDFSQGDSFSGILTRLALVVGNSRNISFRISRYLFWEAKCSPIAPRTNPVDYVPPYPTTYIFLLFAYGFRHLEWFVSHVLCGRGTNGFALNKWRSVFLECNGACGGEILGCQRVESVISFGSVHTFSGGGVWRSEGGGV